MSPIPTFQSLLLYGQLFLSYRPFWLFEKSAHNDPKWTWTTHGQRYVRYTCILLVSPTLKFYPFSLYTQSFFEIQAILRQVNRMTPRWPEPYKVKFLSVSCHDQTVSSYRPFLEKCTKWPQNDLNATRSKEHRIYVTYIPESKIWCVLLCEFNITSAKY